LANLKPKLKLLHNRQELLNSKEVRDVLCHHEMDSAIKELFFDILATSRYIKVNYGDLRSAGSMFAT